MSEMITPETSVKEAVKEQNIQKQVQNITQELAAQKEYKKYSIMLGVITGAAKLASWIFKPKP